MRLSCSTICILSSHRKPETHNKHMTLVMHEVAIQYVGTFEKGNLHAIARSINRYLDHSRFPKINKHSDVVTNKAPDQPP